MDSNNKNLNDPEQIDEQGIEELRRIITGLGTKELEKIRRWLIDTDAFAEDISTVIPISIKHLVEKRIVLPQTLLPIIEEAIESSVHMDPHKLADALFPIMGPAIRKAVSEDLKKMIQSMNSVLEKSFSLKRLGWRFQSMFSSRSYADIVMSNILIYRVRQVFLIHRKTGILLRQKIDKYLFNYEYEVIELNEEQKLKLEELKDMIEQILAGGADPSDFEVELIGYTLSAGNIESNKEYISRRADILRDELIKMGIQPDNLGYTW